MAKSLLERGIMIRTCHNYDGWVKITSEWPSKIRHQMKSLLWRLNRFVSRWSNEKSCGKSSRELW